MDFSVLVSLIDFSSVITALFSFGLALIGVYALKVNIMFILSLIDSHGLSGGLSLAAATYKHVPGVIKDKYFPNFTLDAHDLRVRYFKWRLGDRF